ncbi:MAG TPA: PDZ domain-containing protein [Actinospica sp.]|nr:PDZ domain-containing protein [Actinospica sp.]
MAESSYFRFPHLSGNLLTFVAEDDVWLAPLDEAAAGEARAWRATADRALVRNPRLNPSGTRLAWTSLRDGGPEAYAVAVDGGPVERLTYTSGSNREGSLVRGWLGESEVLVASTVGHHRSARTWLHAVPLDGAPMRELPYGPASDVSVSPEGAVLVDSVYFSEPAWWKRYGGGTGGKIWYSPDGREYERILGDVGNHLVNAMWVGGRVAFLSDHEGVGALYSSLPDGTDLRRHVDPGEYYARHAATDGARVVYQRAGELWLLESLDAEPIRLRMSLGGVRTGRAPFPVPAASALGGYGLCRTGRILATEVRGTAHWLPVEDGPARTLLAEPGVRGRLPLILPGTSTVVCVSDADGEDGLDLIAADGGGENRRVLSGRLGRVLELAASPDARTVAVATDDGRLLTVDVADGTATEIARSTQNEVAGLTFSPDSALLAWSQQWYPGDSPNSHIRLARLADGAVVDVTAPRFNDHSPVFTLDGKYLAFLSNRTFDTVYDTQLFDLGFLPGVRPYLVTLAADTPSPFAPELDGRPAKPARPDQGADKGESDAASVPAVRLDLEDLAERVVPFPVGAGNLRDLGAADGALFWLEVPRNGELGEARQRGDEPPAPRLIRFDLGRRKAAGAADAVESYRLSGDGTRLAYRTGDGLTVRASDAKDDEDAIKVDLDRIRVTVQPVSEWRQMYAETWRLMRQNYWRADMGGVDWAAIGERYRPLVDRIGSVDEMHDLLWELQAELGTSHGYVIAPPADRDAAKSQGMLGVDLARDEDGGWRIARVLTSETSVAEGRSPLKAPGVAARPGDAVIAVDGKPVDPVRGPNALLVGKAEQPVELTLRRDGAEDRRVVVTPLASESVLRYHDLISARRALVRELSGGRLGYVQVPDMVSRGWAELHRDLHNEFTRQGLIFDLRENGGGHTSQLVIEKLTRKIIGWDTRRNSSAESYPAEAPRGPIITLTDECAGSDGDIATQAVKRYGLGPVIGTRTWGGVVGYDYERALVDGTLLTQPKLSFWFDTVGWGVENYGVDPDIEIPIPPHDWAAGRDPQLTAAIRLALEALERTPALSPPPLPEIS